MIKLKESLLLYFLVVVVLSGCGRASDNPNESTIITDGVVSSIIELLNKNWEATRESGGSSWGYNGQQVVVWLDPYNDDQILIFEEHLSSLGIPREVVSIEPAVTDEMREERLQKIQEAVSSTPQIISIDEVNVSQTGIEFTLKNTTRYHFSYGSPFDLAIFENGNWQPVEKLDGLGNTAWTSLGFTLQPGGVLREQLNWEWLFGELGPGRYMFIREGYLITTEESEQGGWGAHPRETFYALVEFEIKAHSPIALEAMTTEQVDVIEVQKIFETTNHSVVLTLENVSDFNIYHRVQILALVKSEEANTVNWWDWPVMPFEASGDWIQAEDHLPSGAVRNVTVDWSSLFGTIEPGDYFLVLDLGGKADAPHPTGFAFNHTANVLKITVE